MDEKAEDFETVLRWTFDRYPRVGTGSSLGSYWRLLKKHFLELKGRYMDENVARDVIMDAQDRILPGMWKEV